MKLNELLTGKSKNTIIGVLMLIALFTLLPVLVRVVGILMAPYTDDEVVITTVSYASEDQDESGFNLIVGNLYQPSPKFGDDEYPAIIACHGFLFGAGKESMHRWCVEIAKRGFIVLSIDLPGNGMSIGEMSMVPRADYESIIIEDGFKFLKGYDFVDGSSLGLIGISYGGGVVSMCGGVLGDMVDATISLNGFTNFTNWLIESILPDGDIEFSVTKDYINFKKFGDTTVTKDNIKDLLRLFGLILGNDDVFEDLIIPGTTHLDRDFLKLFDAVEYLPNAKNDSVMFIHSQRDSTFGYTNQSGQGYDAITNEGNKAYYIPVDDNHQLMDDPDYNSDYCIINFFEEKLKGEDLGDDWDSDYEKYTQRRDIELTTSPQFGFWTLYECLIAFFLSLIPFFLIITIIFYNKKIATERAIKEEEILIKKKKDPDFVDFSLGRGSFNKTVIFLIFMYLIAYTALIGIGLGFFHDIIAGFLGATFYFTLFMALYYVPDQAEVDLWERLKEKRNLIGPKKDTKEIKIFDINSLMVLFIILAIVIVGTIIGYLVSTLSTTVSYPLEPIFTSMLIIGSIFLITGISFLYITEKKENEGFRFTELNWSKYGLSKYQIIKGITFGSVLFLNFFVQYTLYAFYMKFPIMMGPHSIYYLYICLAVLLFFGGIQILSKILKEKLFRDNINIRDNKLRKIFIELFNGFLILIILGVVTYFAFYPVLKTSLFGNLTWYAVGLFVLIYLITNIIKLFCVDKGVFGISIFFPLYIFAILAFFLHI